MNAVMTSMNRCFLSLTHSCFEFDNEQNVSLLHNKVMVGSEEYTLPPMVIAPLNTEDILMDKYFSKILCVVAILMVSQLTGCYKSPEIAAEKPPKSTVANNVLDIDVTTNVKMALMNDPILRAFNIEVITNKGDVRLIGIVDSQSQIDSAMLIAKGAEGTHAIHDELTVKRSSL